MLIIIFGGENLSKINNRLTCFNEDSIKFICITIRTIKERIAYLCAISLKVLGSFNCLYTNFFDNHYSNKYNKIYYKHIL